MGSLYIFTVNTYLLGADVFLNTWLRNIFITFHLLLILYYISLPKVSSLYAMYLHFIGFPNKY
jgi:hypothetical protein